MRRLIKFVLIVAVLCVAFAAYSYLGARFTVGRMLGPEAPLSGRTIQFAYKGAPELPGRPRVWVFTYNRSKLPGVTRAQIYVSFNGRIVTTRPRDLDQLLFAWEKTRLP